MASRQGPPSAYPTRQRGERHEIFDFSDCWGFYKYTVRFEIYDEQRKNIGGLEVAAKNYDYYMIMLNSAYMMYTWPDPIEWSTA